MTAQSIGIYSAVIALLRRNAQACRGPCSDRVKYQLSSNYIENDVHLGNVAAGSQLPLARSMCSSSHVSANILGALVNWHALFQRCSGVELSGLLVSILMFLGVQQPAQAQAGVPSDVHPADWPTVPQAVTAAPDIEKFVQQLLDAMTLEEKVGQLIQADIDSIRPADLAQYPLGSILAGGGAAPGGDVHATGARWLDRTAAFFRASTQSTASAHPPIPILLGIDA